jgi:hypothetical protein
VFRNALCYVTYYVTCHVNELLCYRNESNLSSSCFCLLLLWCVSNGRHRIHLTSDSQMSRIVFALYFAMSDNLSSARSRIFFLRMDRATEALSQHLEVRVGTRYRGGEGVEGGGLRVRG